MSTTKATSDIRRLTTTVGWPLNAHRSLSRAPRDESTSNRKPASAAKQAAGTDVAELDELVNRLKRVSIHTTSKAPLSLPTRPKNRKHGVAVGHSTLSTAARSNGIRKHVSTTSTRSKNKKAKSPKQQLDEGYEADDDERK